MAFDSIPQWLYNPLGAWFNQMQQGQAQVNGLINPDQRRLGETAPGFDDSISGAELTQALDRLSNMVDPNGTGSGRLTQDQYRQLFSQLSNHASLSIMNSVMADADRYATDNENRGRLDTDRARHDQALVEGQHRLDDIEMSVGKDIKNDQNRFSKILGVGDYAGKGTGLRSDAEYGAILKQATDILGAQMGSAQMAQAKQHSDAGLRASGKGSDLISSATNRAFGSLSDTSTRLMSDVQGRLDNANERSKNFQLGVADARTQLDSGFLGSLSGLDQFRTGMQTISPTAWQTGFDTSAMLQGSRNTERAMSTQEILGLLGMFQNQQQMSQNGMQQMVGMFKGGG